MLLFLCPVDYSKSKWGMLLPSLIAGSQLLAWLIFHRQLASLFCLFCLAVVPTLAFFFHACGTLHQTQQKYILTLVPYSVNLRVLIFTTLRIRSQFD